MANALADVQDTYVSLNANYNLLYAACRDDGQRKDLQEEYADAQSAYQKCVGKMLSDDDSNVGALCVQLRTVNTQIKKAVEEMGDMSKVIDTIDKALEIGGEIAAKAGL